MSVAGEELSYYEFAATVVVGFAGRGVESSHGGDWYLRLNWLRLAVLGLRRREWMGMLVNRSLGITTVLSCFLE